MSASHPARIGGYEILSRLGVGGMAEVYEAARTGPHGFRKRVALKRILPHLGRNEEFAGMFIGEAKLAAHLDHPNIVQVFDFGEVDGELFIAMELVAGSSVNKVLRCLAERGSAVPLDATLHIIGQTARALAYAHNATDERGRSLELVHRDVSPANLLITADGHIKLADFGIARAAISERNTEVGHLRGKLGYMSPEQVRGEPLTGRSDVFALATVLAELNLGETLFARGSDLDIMLRIRDVDLSVLHSTSRSIPKDVYKLIMLGLDRDPWKRPAAIDFARTLTAMEHHRGFVEQGSETLARLLRRYKLVDTGSEQHASLQPVPRRRALVTLESGRDGALIQQGRVFERIQRARETTYTLEGGATGVHFADVVKLLTAGSIDGSMPISKRGEPCAPIRRLPEFQRYFATDALQWRPEEIAHPKLRGSLSGAILLPLMHSLMVKRETGLLHLEERSSARRKKIYLVGGRPDFVASTDNADMLGDFLVRCGKINAMELDMAVAFLPDYQGRLGDAMVTLGILRPLELFRSMAHQVRSRYLDAFRWRDGDWCYVPGTRSGEETYPIEADHQALMRDASLELDAQELEAALSPMWDKALEQAAAPPAPLSAYQLPDAWRWVIDKARGDATVGEIFDRSRRQHGIRGEDVLRALFLGISCQLLTS